MSEIARVQYFNQQTNEKPSSVLMTEICNLTPYWLMKLREKDPWKNHETWVHVFCLAVELEMGVLVCYKARKENPVCKSAVYFVFHFPKIINKTLLFDSSK